MEKWFNSLGYEMTDDNFGVTAYSLNDDIADDGLSEDGTEEDIIQSESNLDWDGTPPDEAICESDMEMYYSNAGIMAFSSLAAATQPVPADKADIVFCFNNGISGLTYSEYRNIKLNIENIGKGVFDATKDARIYVLDQRGNSLQASSGRLYASNIDEFLGMVDQLTNIRYDIRAIDRQVRKLLNTINFRDDAFKAAVFTGRSYYTTSEILPLIPDIATADIHCCVVCPNAQANSFYDRLAQDTDGILLRSNHDFSDDILNFIYGYIPVSPIASYHMMTSTGLKTICLDSELKVNGTTDTDSDGLTDWEEIDQRYMIANADGSVTLWTYRQCYMQLLDYMDAGAWYRRYGNLMSKSGKTVHDIMDEIYVLPILSNPTMTDSDNDGIPDAKEPFTWDGIDERYKKMGPLHKDTIETLFPEIRNKGNNKPDYPTYLTVNGNDVVMHVNVVVGTGDSDKDAMSVLKTSNLSVDEQTEMNNIVNRLADSNGVILFRDLALDGIKNRWEGSYHGNQYDFHEGLTVNFSIDITEKVPKWHQKEVKIVCIDGLCGKSHQSGVIWKTKCSRFITMYSSYCGEKSHVNQSGANCINYKDNLYHPAEYQGTVAHEFGHVFGLKDMYWRAGVNHNYEPITNIELVYDKNYFGLHQAKGIMICSGSACENDIEMLLLAFSENTWQYYVPYGSTQAPSKAIKHPVQYTYHFGNGSQDSHTYIWDDIKKVFV